MIDQFAAETMLLAILPQAAVIESWRRDWWSATRLSQWLALGLTIAAIFKAIPTVWATAGVVAFTLTFIWNVRSAPEKRTA